VTPETFAAWQERKRKRKQEEVRKLVQAELKKKKGGKGLSVLSGRDLYEFKKDLFTKVDDEDDFATMEDEEGDEIADVSNGIQKDLFLNEDDDDLDDLDDLEDD
jgi:hypothetical protein